MKKISTCWEERKMGKIINTCRGLEKFEVVETLNICGVDHYLLQSEIYRDEVPYIVMDEGDNILAWEWHSDLEDWSNTLF